jgi:hypothetical protein
VFVFNRKDHSMQKLKSEVLTFFQWSNDYNMMMMMMTTT